MMADYLDRLAGALRFDRSLASRVCEEIEDHLREAAAADRSDDRREAERRAIAHCGDPSVIAAEFAVITLARRMQRLRIGIPLVIAGAYMAMKARIAWYAALQWVIRDDAKPIAAVVGSIDAYAFLTSVIIGVAAAVYIGNRHVPSRLLPEYYRRLRRFRWFCAVATGALVLSVTSDAALTILRLLETDASTAFFVPIFSIAFEIATAGALVVAIRDLAQRTALAAALQKM